MVNVYFNWSSLLGISLAVAGAGLYFLRSVQPRLARDHDIFFAAVGLLCGGILFFQGWRQDPILQFGQFLLGGSAIFFGVESVRLRGVATEQAKRNTRIVDDERPVSKVYSYVDAELERLEPEEDMGERPRIRGREEGRSRRAGEAYYEDEEPRRPKSAKPRSSDDRYGTEETSRKRKPRSTEPRPNSNRYDEWDGTVETEEPPTSTSRPANRKPVDPNRPKRRRPPEDERRRPPAPSETSSSDEYVDYQPINPRQQDEDDSDNESNFDY
ncbi:Ycf66 family protein [Ancylothrix sp. C2]|uniref:Ycf66 family protein n=1 Tax=Ancylothrix sp. D3o TaxID=2953691 RepID=UPI0021BAC0D6|nr:Ycf66 family protein [Ancylothrix sp. D3o]MCT7948634.1 Ycf66 family protein [Ancylothrix sp. D3o]